MLHVLTSRIEVVNHLVCIGLVACSEDHYLEILSQTSQEFFCAWTDVERSNHRPAATEINGQFNLVRLAQFLKTMDQCFVEIKDYCRLS